MIKNTVIGILSFIILVLAVGLYEVAHKAPKEIITTGIIYNNDTVRNIIRFVQPSRTLPFIKVKINGKDAYFLLDTGASFTVIDENQAAKYKVRCTEIPDQEFKGIGGSNTLSETDLTSVEIEGKILITEFKASDLGAVCTTLKNATGFSVVGILGSDFFERYGFVFDYNKNTLFMSK